MNAVLRICAGFIDLLQFVLFVVFLAFQAITPVGGTVAGAAAGAVVCWNMSDGIISGVVNGALCAAGGGAAGGIISALATPIGMVIDVAISSTFGVLLILLMWVTGRFYLMPVALGFAGEMMPGINGFAPFWSILVHRCIHMHNMESRGVGTTARNTMGILEAVSSLAPGGTVAKTALRPALAMAGNTAAATVGASRDSSRTPLKNFDGIRAANDSAPRTTYAKTA